MSCIFCQIVDKRIPANFVYEDDAVVAFSDINPQAPHHYLIVPKVHYENLLAVPKDSDVFNRVYSAIDQVVNKAGIAETGFRVVVNTKDDGGQTVPHLHFHVLGGRFMTWPPG